MTEIENLVEGSKVVVPDYTATTFSDESIARGDHRQFVGGGWERKGKLQANFMKKHGLSGHHKYLDVGCGAFRAGRHIIEIVDPGNYYGVDANLSLLQTGYDIELNDDQRARLPVANIRANDRFNCDFGEVRFDYAIAQSVFTHISLNHIRLCLYRVGKVMAPGGVFYATFNEQPESRPLDYVYDRVEGGRSYFNEKNVFWYHRSDMKWASTFGPWKFRYIGSWGNEHGQKMVAFTRMTDAEIAKKKADEARVASSKQRLATPAVTRAEKAQRLALRARRKAARILDPS